MKQKNLIQFWNEREPGAGFKAKRIKYISNVYPYQVEEHVTSLDKIIASLLATDMNVPPIVGRKLEIIVNNICRIIGKLPRKARCLHWKTNVRQGDS